MNPRIAIVLGAIFALAIVVPAFAQYSDATSYPAGYPANYPWFTNDVRSQSFQQFLASDPRDAQEIAPNPQVIYDRNWRMQHQPVESYFQSHPEVWDWLQQWGDYDSQHQWHDAYWWHENDRDWYYDSHPSGLRATRNGATRMAPMISSKFGDMGNGGISKIRVGSKVTIPRGSSKIRLGATRPTCKTISSSRWSSRRYFSSSNRLTSSSNR